MSKLTVITAPEDYDHPVGARSVFLAGGITGCSEWQAEAIDLLRRALKSEGSRDERVVLFNPRRDNFPIHDPGAARQQIEWEFYALEEANVFSIWFDADQIQPICMYELGRHMAKRDPAFVCVGAHPRYPRRLDVLIQAELASPKRPAIQVAITLEEHVTNIVRALRMVW